MRRGGGAFAGTAVAAPEPSGFKPGVWDDGVPYSESHWFLTAIPTLRGIVGQALAEIPEVPEAKALTEFEAICETRRPTCKEVKTFGFAMLELSQRLKAARPILTGSALNAMVGHELRHDLMPKGDLGAFE